MIIIIINCLQVYSGSVGTELFFKCSLNFISVLPTSFLPSFLPSFVRSTLFAGIKDDTFVVCSQNSNGALDIQVQFNDTYSSHRQGNYRTARYFCTNCTTRKSCQC